ncbi:MAG: phosphatase PAP2 family protein [Actinomycetota bacterium]|nr:phosphatase PAP2 family protein [Actinomycetota bacterium]
MAVFVVVGIRPSDPPIQPFDNAVLRAADSIRNTPLTFIAKVLNVIGGGLVTIPLRIIVAGYLALRRRWRALTAWLMTWLFAEVLLTMFKALYDRPRPPHPLVLTTGASFPSGHAVAASATAVALVLAVMPPGSGRRKWEIIAAVFAFVMALSRVYLNAHWFSDVVAGTLLGTGISIACAALATEARDVLLRRRAARGPDGPQAVEGSRTVPGVPGGSTG